MDYLECTLATLAQLNRSDCWHLLHPEPSALPTVQQEEEEEKRVKEEVEKKEENGWWWRKAINKHVLRNSQTVLRIRFETSSITTVLTEAFSAKYSMPVVNDK